MIVYDTHEVTSNILTQEGEQIAREGSHEARVWAALTEKGSGPPVTSASLKKLVGDETSKVGQGRAFKNGWIGKERDGFVKLVCSTHFPFSVLDNDRSNRSLASKIQLRSNYKRSCPQDH